jgi:hypothetical protein
MRGVARYILGNLAELAMRVGDIDWVLPELDEAIATNTLEHVSALRRAEIRGVRGEDVEADLQALADIVAAWTEVQGQSSVSEVRAEVALAQGDARAALDHARQAYRLKVSPDAIATQIAIRAAVALGDAAAVTDALESMAGVPGRVPEVIRREGAAGLAALEGRRSEALAGFLDAWRRWSELGLGFEAALCAVAMVTVLGVPDDAVRVAADAAAVTFERVGATPLSAQLAERRARVTSHGVAAPVPEPAAADASVAGER